MSKWILNWKEGRVYKLALESMRFMKSKVSEVCTMELSLGFMS